MSRFGPSSRPPNRPQFDRRPPKPTLHPRRVVGGIKLTYRPPVAAGGDGSAAGDVAAMRAMGEQGSVGRVADAVPASKQAPADSRGALQSESGGYEAADGLSVVEAPDGGDGGLDHARVGGGVARAAAGAGGWTWASARWMRLAEDRALGEQLVEGLEYARAGQTRSIEMKAGLVSARVQGRIPTAYKTELRMPTISAEQWAVIIQSMGEQSRFGPALLSNELPNTVEDLFAPLGLKLIPTDEADLATSCTCDVFRGRDSLTGTPLPGGGSRWCKHICCVMYLVAERLAREPLMAFALRGMDEAEVLEHMRQHRAMAGLARTGGGSAPAYVQHVVARQELGRPLEECVRERGARGFWTVGSTEAEGLASVDLSVVPPVVSHPLLRRLGVSPFKDSKFPMVGLLATCYEVVGDEALRGVPAPDGGSVDSTSQGTAGQMGISE